MQQSIVYLLKNNSDSIEAALASHNFQVLVFNNEFEMLKALEKLRPSALILLIEQKKLAKNLETVRLTKKFDSTIPVFGYTYTPNTKNTVELVKAGIDNIFDYPLDKSNFIELLHLAISKAEALNNAAETPLAQATLRELERKTYALGMANVEMLRMQEELEAKNVTLKETEARFHQLVDNISEIFWIYDTINNKTIYVSPAIETIAGISQKEATENFASVLERVHPDDIEAVKENLRSGVSEKNTVEYRIIKKDGSVRWIREKAFPIIDANDSVICICGISEDYTDKKNIELALKQSESALRTVFNSVYDAIVLHDVNGNFIDVNDKMMVMFASDYKKSLALKFPEFTMISEKKLKSIWKKVLKNQPHFDEWNIIKPVDNSKLVVEVYLQKINFNKQDVILTSIRDITERKKVEENLLLYRNIFRNVNDPIMILDKDKRILQINSAGERTFGYKIDELIGRRTDFFIGEAEFSNMMTVSNLNGNSGIRRELKLETKDKRHIYIEVSGVTIENNDGEIIYRVGISRDITKRKIAEMALQKAHDELEKRIKARTKDLEIANIELRESQARNVALLDAIPDLMFRIDQEGKYLDYNTPKHTDLSNDEKSFIGKNIREFIDEKDANKIINLVKKSIKTNKRQVAEYQIWHNDHPHFFEARIVKSGKNEAIAIVRDITDQKKAAKELKQAQALLEKRVLERTAELQSANLNLRNTQAQLFQSEKMAALGTLVAGIAHEINTPIGAINSSHNTQERAFIKMTTAMKDAFGEKFENATQIQRMSKIIIDSHKVISSGTDRVTEIVKRLRSFARLDEADLKEVDIHDGIEDTLVLIHHEIKHHIKIEKDYGELPIISCFPGKLNQVLLNLLINAKQSFKDEGIIKIKTRHIDKFIHISITDNGSGIPEANLSKIFDPGFTTKGVGVGTGLGLSIVFRIIKEDHKGDIQVESEVGKGTTFTLIIPDHLDELVSHT